MASGTEYQEINCASLLKTMVSKHRVSIAHIHETRNLPIPLILFSSYIAAEKSDELIKVFCKELPGILKNINDSKKALENKTKSLYKLKEAITLDLKKLELAQIVLKELYDEEGKYKDSKKEQLQSLHSKISSCQNSMNVLKCSLNQYSKSREALDSVAVALRQYKDARDLIHSYLTLQAMNEKFIDDEYKSANQFKTSKMEKIKLQKLAMKHKYDVTIQDKKLELLDNHIQILKNLNYTLSHRINETLQYRMKEQLIRLQIKRWVYDISLKIHSYQENPSHTEDFFKLLTQAEEFIIFARLIVAKLENISQVKHP